MGQKKQTGEHIKAKALKSIVISDDAKARHIYTQVVQLEDAPDKQQARVCLSGLHGKARSKKKVGRGFRDMVNVTNNAPLALTHRSALVMESWQTKINLYNKVQERLNEGTR